jgi:glycosyltransferase involved in cell wall biosynthesis
VTILAKSTQPGVHRGVRTIQWSGEEPILRDLRSDVAILLRLVGHAAQTRAMLPPETKLLLWLQDDHMQKSVQPLADPAQRGALTAIAAVSHWQREQFLLQYRLPIGLIRVIGNPLPPPFDSNSPEVPAKPWPPVLAYTSTPFRGLNVLLDIFPAIRARIPGTRLKVFSSLRVYQIPEQQDLTAHGELYERCRRTDGVDYVGSVSQPRLADELRSINALAYPNTFPETFCVSAIEALASGCRIVTTDLGALPETTANFADLVPTGPGYKERYADRLVGVLEECRPGASGSGADLLKRQIAYARSKFAPAVVARVWEHWFSQLVLPTGTAR